jgi:hypothetical protein
VALRDLDNDGDADLIAGGVYEGRQRHRRRDHRPAQQRAGIVRHP